MKKIVFIIAFAAIVCSCTENLSNFQDDDDLISFDLSLSGEVSTIEEPLTKSEDSKALLGIQVYQGTSPYAWGLFDRTEGIRIYLHSGESYSVVCQYIKNGKESLKLFEQSRDATIRTYKFLFANNGNMGWTGTENYWTVAPTDGPKLAYFNGKYYNFHKYSSGYGTPFNVIDNYNYNISDSYYWCTDYYVDSRKRYYVRGTTIKYPLTVCSITNSFVYDNTNTINVASSEAAALIESEIDRYYGESGTFTASYESNRVISLDMKHLVYGVQCNVTGVSDGSASITITNGDRTLLNKDSISGEYHSDVRMFAFSNMHGAWEYADNYIENVTVSMTWLRGVGVLQDLGSQIVQVKRNRINVINVSLSTVIPASSAASEKTQLTDTNNVRAEFSINNVMQ